VEDFHQLFDTVIYFFPLTKWGISTKFKILVFTKPVALCFGCSIGSPNGLVPRISMYTCCANSGNFLVSTKSFSEYISRVGVAHTSYGMCGSTTEASGYLCEDRTMGCFPFLITGVVEVLASCSLSSPDDSSFPVISFTWPSSCYMNRTIICGLFASEFVLSMSLPCLMWAASTLAVCCQFLVVTSTCLCMLSCDAISIPAIVGDSFSSTTSVAITGSTCGEGIASTSIIPSLCAISCVAFAVSCCDLRLLQVLHDVWLRKETF
jgi:hypothetical protein